MAVILGVFDPDNDRRVQTRNRLSGSLSGLARLTRGQASLRDLDIYWEASASTPVSTAEDRLQGRERLALVVGDFDAPYAVVSDAAQRLLQRTASTVPDVACISGQNGYYFAALFEEPSCLVLGTDVLGLFPLYYWEKRDIFMFGTSPELFRCHPLFVAEPNAYGIASVLLVNHLCGGQSLYKDVRRTGVGHYVQWTPKEGVREVEANPLRMSDTSFATPYEASLERVSSCLNAFHAALRALPQVDVFLSGGQDSRTVAGYLNRHVARNAVRAVSLGSRSDQELQYARKVSRVFGWQHRYQDVEFDKYPAFAAMQLRLESLQGPFVNFANGTAQTLLAERSGPFVSGYLGDPVIGDGQVAHAVSPQTGQIEFDQLFRTINGYGFDTNDAIDLMSSHDGRHAPAEVVDTLKDDWNRIDALPFQKAWLFAMTHRIRFHVGSIVWRLSLGSWPLLPYYDRSLLAAMASMPLNHLRGRRMQVDILKRDFPRLATLPLDRNAVGPEYLVTPLHRKFLPHFSDVSWRLHRLLERGRERRYYVRVYDFNAPGWRLIRHEAERFRRQAGALLRPEALDRLLPRADAKPHYTNAVQGAAKTKTLLGLVLWNGSHLDQPH